MFELGNALKVSHDYMEQIIQPGDTVIDATVGNGKDTLFLAGLVGETGHVFGFDVQPLALERTREKLEAAGLSGRVTLVCDGHQHMEQYAAFGIRFAAFNLGYLPGADKQVTTMTDTTLAAIEAALRLLAPKAMCSVCVYPGHEEGRRELEAVFRLLSSLDARKYTVIHRNFINQPKNPPELFSVWTNF